MHNKNPLYRTIIFFCYWLESSCIYTNFVLHRIFNPYQEVNYVQGIEI